MINILLIKSHLSLIYDYDEGHFNAVFFLILKIFSTMINKYGRI